MACDQGVFSPQYSRKSHRLILRGSGARQVGAASGTVLLLPMGTGCLCTTEEWRIATRSCFEFPVTGSLIVNLLGVLDPAELDSTEMSDYDAPVCYTYLCDPQSPEGSNAALSGACQTQVLMRCHNGVGDIVSPHHLYHFPSAIRGTV